MRRPPPSRQLRVVPARVRRVHPNVGTTYKTSGAGGELPFGTHATLSSEMTLMRLLVLVSLPISLLTAHRIRSNRIEASFPKLTVRSSVVPTFR